MAAAAGYGGMGRLCRCVGVLRQDPRWPKDTHDPTDRLGYTRRAPTGVGASAPHAPFIETYRRTVRRQCQNVQARCSVAVARGAPTQPPMPDQGGGEQPDVGSVANRRLPFIVQLHRLADLPLDIGRAVGSTTLTTRAGRCVVPPSPCCAARWGAAGPGDAPHPIF